MPVGVAISITLPTIGQASWGGPLNTALQAIVDAVEEMVPASSIDIDGDLDFQGQYAVNLKASKFVATADPGTANTLFVGTDGEVYIRDGSNNLIQVTDGGVLNIGLSGGGFGGDYVTAGARALYSSAGGLYTFETPTAGTYARVEHGELRLHNGSSTGYTSLKPPSATATVMDLVLPAALPSTRTFVMCDATGTMFFEPSMHRDSRGLVTSGSFAVIGASVFSGTIAHTQQVTWLDAAAGNAGTGGATSNYAADSGWSFGAGVATIDFPVPLMAGTRVNRVDAWVTRGGSTPITASLMGRVPGAAAQAVATTTFNTGSGLFNMTMTPAHVMATSSSYIVRFRAANAGSDNVWGIRLYFDRPEGT